MEPHERRNRYVVETGPLGTEPIPPLGIPPQVTRGDRLQYTDKGLEILRGRFCWVTRWDTRTGMFWTYVPTISENDSGYKRHEFGPYMAGDIGKTLQRCKAGRFVRAPDLDKVFARFKFKHSDRRPSRFKRLEG